MGKIDEQMEKERPSSASSTKIKGHGSNLSTPGLTVFECADAAKRQNLHKDFDRSADKQVDKERTSPSRQPMIPTLNCDFRVDWKVDPVFAEGASACVHKALKTGSS